MAKVTLHPEASEEYLASLAWYAERSLPTANRFQRVFEEAVQRAADNPESYPKYDDGIRYVLLDRFPFSLLYEWNGSHVKVIAVAHSSREPEYWRHRA